MDASSVEPGGGISEIRINLEQANDAETPLNPPGSETCKGKREEKENHPPCEERSRPCPTCSSCSACHLSGEPQQRRQQPTPGPQWRQQRRRRRQLEHKGNDGWVRREAQGRLRMDPLMADEEDKTWGGGPLRGNCALTFGAGMAMAGWVPPGTKSTFGLLFLSCSLLSISRFISASIKAQTKVNGA